MNPIRIEKWLYSQEIPELKLSEELRSNSPVHFHYVTVTWQTVIFLTGSISSLVHRKDKQEKVCFVLAS